MSEDVSEVHKELLGKRRSFVAMCPDWNDY